MVKACVYWLHLPEHSDMFSEGYIGVSVNPKKRLYEHKRSIDKNTTRILILLTLSGNMKKLFFQF